MAWLAYKGVLVHHHARQIRWLAFVERKLRKQKQALMTVGFYHGLYQLHDLRNHGRLE